MWFQILIFLHFSISLSALNCVCSPISQVASSSASSSPFARSAVISLIHCKFSCGGQRWSLSHSTFHRKIAVLSLAGASSWLLRPPRLAASPGLHADDKTKTLVTRLRQPVVHQRQEKKSVFSHHSGIAAKLKPLTSLNLSFNHLIDYQAKLQLRLPSLSWEPDGGFQRALVPIQNLNATHRSQCRTGSKEAAWGGLDGITATSPVHAAWQRSAFASKGQTPGVPAALQKAAKSGCLPQIDLYIYIYILSTSASTFYR